MRKECKARKCSIKQQINFLNNEIKILEVKNTITKIKYIMNGLNCKVDTVKERTD